MFFPHDIWPSCSPDLIICDFWLFSVIEQQSYATSRSLLSLKKNV